MMTKQIEPKNQYDLNIGMAYQHLEWEAESLCCSRSPGLNWIVPSLYQSGPVRSCSCCHHHLQDYTKIRCDMIKLSDLLDDFTHVKLSMK